MKVTQASPLAGWSLTGVQEPVNWVCGGPTSTVSAPLTVVTLWSIPSKVHWKPFTPEEIFEMLSGLAGEVSVSSYVSEE